MLIIGDSHVRPLTLLRKSDIDVLPISGATMSGTVNPVSATNSRQIILKQLAKERRRRVVLSLGEVDVGFLCLIKGEQDVRLIRKQIDHAVERYYQFYSEMNEHFAVEQLYVSTIYPSIILDKHLRKAKIKLRRKIRFDIAERNAFINYCNDLICSRFENVLNLHAVFLERIAGMRCRHINTRDHHYDSFFYVSAYCAALQNEGLIDGSIMLPSRSRAFVYDVKNLFQ